ncbi:MAG: hypothetical protein WCA28_01510 [Bradyrhizobium sp.]
MGSDPRQSALTKIGGQRFAADHTVIWLLIVWGPDADRQLGYCI